MAVTNLHKYMQHFCKICLEGAISLQLSNKAYLWYQKNGESLTTSGAKVTTWGAWALHALVFQKLVHQRRSRKEGTVFLFTSHIYFTEASLMPRSAFPPFNRGTVTFWRDLFASQVPLHFTLYAAYNKRWDVCCVDSPEQLLFSVWLPRPALLCTVPLEHTQHSLIPEAATTAVTAGYGLAQLANLVFHGPFSVAGFTDLPGDKISSTLQIGIYGRETCLLHGLQVKYKLNIFYIYVFNRNAPFRNQKKSLELVAHPN